MAKYLTAGIWESDMSDLRVEIIKVAYQTDVYAKIKCNITHKKHRHFYEGRSNYKVYKENIKHWHKVPLLRN